MFQLQASSRQKDMDVLLSLSDVFSGYSLGLPNFISGRIGLPNRVFRRAAKVEFCQRLAEGIALQTWPCCNELNSLGLPHAFYSQQAIF